jgi:hypothetical protein
LNLEAAVCAYECLRQSEGRERTIWAHIANERLAETAKNALHTKGDVKIKFFDTYNIAAQKMVAKHFDRKTRSGVSEVTILGFGKFGRDLFEIIIKDTGEDEKISIAVMDVFDKENEVKKLAKDLGVEDHVTFKQADINDIELVDDTHKAFFLCTDDDLGNLTGAMMLAGKSGGTHIYVRMTHWPMAAMADHLGEDRGVVFININELVRKGLKELPGIIN